MNDAAPSLTPLTTLLRAWREGDGVAFQQVVDELHHDLQDMARRRLRADNPLVTFSPADLLQDAIVRVMESPPDFQNRAHFMATMSMLMRSILTDYARGKLADKRGGGAVNLTYTESGNGEESMVLDVLALDQALTRLQTLDERAAEIVHLTYFGGLSREEIASVLKLSVPTVDRDLKFARAWIERAMSGEA